MPLLFLTMFLTTSFNVSRLPRSSLGASPTTSSRNESDELRARFRVEALQHSEVGRVVHDRLSIEVVPEEAVTIDRAADAVLGGMREGRVEIGRARRVRDHRDGPGGVPRRAST